MEIISRESDVFERCLVEHCSPTLASIKTGNLFNLPYTDQNKLTEQIYKWNKELNHKGVSIDILRCSKQKALIYVYRRNKLKEDFDRNGVKDFLKNIGYICTDIDCAVENLRNKLCCNGSFPHEIGLFLGYPLEDVVGFIINEGENCKCTGFWKVYCNRYDAERTFIKFRRCISKYMQLWQNGRSICQLTV